jgi:predicted Zn-dependent peptidase
MVERMLNDRFGEIARRAEAPFLGASASDADLTPDVSSFALAARVQEGRVEDGVAALTTEARRAREWGFTPSEVDRTRNAYWLGRLQSVSEHGRDPGEILTRPARIAAITPAVVQDAFRRYFPLDRYTVAVLVPEPRESQPKLR